MNRNVTQTVELKYGSTPLHYASQNGHMDIIQYLITELGCDTTMSNNNGLLPLHIASLKWSLELLSNISSVNRNVIHTAEP